MTPRWRVMLRVRALLQTLLARHVPLGVLAELVSRLQAYSDDDLVAVHKAEMTGTVGQLAFELAGQVVDEEPFEPARASDGDNRRLWRAQRAAWQGVIEELRRRRALHRAVAETQIDDRAAAVADELDELLVFIGRQQAPNDTPLELKALDEFLASGAFYDAMQTYRHADASSQRGVSEAFGAVVEAIRKAVRQ